MFKSILRDRWLILLFSVALVIKLFSLNPAWVERYYTYGFYPFVSKMLRILLGWLPFSFGDVLYILAFVYLVAKVWKLVRLLAKRKLREYLGWVLFRKYLKLVFSIYIVFNLGWGLNYNRQGIEHQLELTMENLSATDLQELTFVLYRRLTFYAQQVDSVKRLRYDNNKILFQQAVEDYKKASLQLPFLSYSVPSIKPSLYGTAGKYFNYTGYYNPFTAEAQLKTSIPVFLKPFVMNHEIAHQLGYAKENEANFVSYLVGKNSNSIDVRYSVYYELFFDAFYQFLSKETEHVAKDLLKNMHPRVKNDRRTYRTYLQRNRNSVAPVMSEAYDRFLKLNNQPKGLETYNEVIIWLLAYMKKYGAAAI